MIIVTLTGCLLALVIYRAYRIIRYDYNDTRTLYDLSYESVFEDYGPPALLFLASNIPEAVTFSLLVASDFNNYCLHFTLSLSFYTAFPNMMCITAISFHLHMLLRTPLTHSIYDQN